MPVLSNPKHERFAQGLANGKTQAEAYEAAGYEPHEANASRLIRNDKVAARLAELLSRGAEKVELSRAWVLEHLMHNALVAVGQRKVKLSVMPKGSDSTVDVEVSMRDAAAANRALELLGREVGMFIDRSEVGLPGEFERLDDAELERKITERAAQMGVSIPSSEATH